MRLYVSLIEAEEPRGLALLREFRTVLARLYATLVEFPAQGPSMTTHTRGSAPDVAHVESELIGRLPTGLYWSALRPLTWDTVGDRGVRDLAEALVDVWSWVKPMVDVSEAAFLNGLEFDMSDICRPLLVGLTILQELVIDLDAYRREWET
jgi:hypothetical protein